jgi:hypothetical protein
MAADQARSIITSTAIMAMKVEMPLSACSGDGNDASRWRRSRFDPPAPDLEYPAVQISMMNGGLIVDYGELRFSLDSDDRPICWDELIIVD